jgi:hypothetical protein
MNAHNMPDDVDWHGEYFKLSDKYHSALLKIIDYKTALQSIASYSSIQFGEGICPYGCDCPTIAQNTLNK